LYEVAYETTFCATHRLTEAGRPIEPLHGHDWKVEIVAMGETLDKIGVVLDFEVLREALRDIAAQFHYRDMNEHPAFVGTSPSAEAVARYIFQELRRTLGDKGERLRRVRVWEAPGCSATYFETA
jgi:6-pyruvoyltetrahydropterin/6-carboxytetrahydropterin synthase